MRLKVGDKVVDAPCNIGGTITGEIVNVDDTGYEFRYLVCGVYKPEDGEEGDNTIWAKAPCMPRTAVSDEFEAMRKCSEALSGLDSLTTQRVINYLEDRFV